MTFRGETKAGAGHTKRKRYRKGRANQLWKNQRKNVLQRGKGTRIKNMGGGGRGNSHNERGIMVPTPTAP